MTRIKILDSMTANQIAAGEVIERPASVIKELIENAIDAEAQNISIKIENGGKSKILIQDDGIGMTHEDLKLAFERHATSKISFVDDLNTLITLGFRGEALASIAAVSKVDIRSCQNSSLGGTQLLIEGGKIIESAPVGCSSGTRICINELFYNTPARKRFLAGDSKETAAVSEIINRLALSHTDVRFSYYNGARISLTTPGDNTLLSTIASIYGTEIAHQMLPVDYSMDYITIKGYISRPVLNRATSNHISFYINGRYIKDAQLVNFLRDTYGARIPSRKFPLAVIHFTLPPNIIDVNVHPQKLAVKFGNPAMVQSVFKAAIENALDAVLNSESLIPGIVFNDKLKDSYDITNANAEKSGDIEPAVTQETFIISEKELEPKDNIEVPTLLDPDLHDIVVNENHKEQFYKHDDTAAEALPPLRVIGQFKASHILAENENTLYLIDQHGAHERILYEEIIQGNFNNTSQLSVPQTVTLTSVETEFLIDNIFLLQQLGFLIEHFGGNSFIIRAVPDFITSTQAEEILNDIINSLINEQKVTSNQLRHHMLLQSSCKTAVKAGQYLDLGELDFLVKRLAKTNYPFSCPHGRPIIIKLTSREIEKMFLRQE